MYFYVRKTAYVLHGLNFNAAAEFNEILGNEPKKSCFIVRQKNVNQRSTHKIKF